MKLKNYLSAYLCILTCILTFSGYAQSIDHILFNDNLTFDQKKAAVNQSFQSKSVLSHKDSVNLKNYGRWVQFWKTRLNTDGTTGYTAAPDANFLNCTSKGNWKTEGPLEVPHAANGVGRIQSIAVYEQNHQIVYAGSNTGGIFKSTDQGLTWNSVFDDSQLRVPGLGVLDIIIHPNNPDFVLIATGLNSPLASKYGAGIYKTTDGGTTWTNVSVGFNPNQNYATVNDLEFEIGNPNVVYATYQDKIMKSTDGGDSYSVFRTNPNGKDFDLIRRINSGTDQLMYVTTKHDSDQSVTAQIWRGVLNTNTWTNVTPPITEYKRWFIAVTPASPNSLFAEYKHNLFISTNKGNTYTAKPLTQSVGGPMFGQTDQKNALTVSPLNANIMYCGGFYAHKSTDQWTSLPTLYSHHADLRAITYISSTANGANDSLLIGHDGGIDLIVGNNIYIRDNPGLNVTQAWDVETMPYDKQHRLVSGNQDNGTFEHRKNYSWRKISYFPVDKDGGDGGSSLYTSFQGNDYVITSQNQKIWRSNANSLSAPKKIVDNICSRYNWDDLCFGVATHTRPMLINTQDPSIFYWGLWKVYRHDLAASNIQTSEVNITPSLDVGQHKMTALAMSYQDTNIIYMATEKIEDSTLLGSDTSIYKRTANGNWIDISPDSANTWEASVTSIAVNPTNDSEVWVTYGGFNDYNTNKKVYKTTDGGTTWANYSEGLQNFPVHEIIYQKGSNNMLYIATDLGVFYRDATMNEWKCFNEGLPPVIVTGLSINYCSGTIYAATYGRGIWSTDILPSSNNTFVNVGSPSGVTWNTNQEIRQSIKIPSGHKLTINNATISVMAGLKIVVDQGGELILNNTTITNQCGAFWSGIEVWGNSPAGTNTQDCSSGPCLTGKLTMYGSYIERAENAVALWNPNDWNMRGGIIYAENSTFINNRRDVVFMPYENQNNVPYQSGFTNCNFIIDSNYPFDQKQLFPARVTLWQVRGVPFEGCTFKNETGSYHNTAGIYAWAANFTVKEKTFPSGTVKPSKFIGFQAGVDVTGGGLGYNFTVDTTHIINCLYGVVANGVDNAVITRNWIKRDEAYANFIQGVNWGIYLNGADQFNIHENNIDNCHTGITARSSGTQDNSIYNNGVENAFVGNWAYGLNYNPDTTTMGLLYSCNIHKNPGIYDIVVSGGTTINGQYFRPGIAENQGSETYPADNTFTSLSAPSIYSSQSISHETVGAIFIDYYAHHNAAGYQLEPLAISGNKVGVHYTTDVFDLSNNCLSGISHFKTEGGVRGRMSGLESDARRIEFNTAKANLAQAKYVYESTINGGNTLALLNSVQTTNPNDAWELRNELIESSPLSEEVLMNLIDEDILSNALLLDVLMTNEQAVHSEDIIEMLETKTTPMPDYMINTFLGLFGELGQEAVLSAEISDAGQKMYSAGRILIAHWYADSTGDDLDSIPALYDEIGAPMTQLQKIAFQRGMQQWAEATGELNNLGNNDDLTLWEQITFGGIQNVYGLYDAERTGGLNNVWNPSVATQAALTQQSADPDTRGGIYAKGWLKFTQNELYLPEEVVFQPPANKRQQRNIFELRDTDTEVLFEIYPNPANDFVTIAMDAYEIKETLHIEILNSIGNIVLEKKNVSTGITNINTVSLPSGIYVVRISDGSTEVQKQILEIIK